MTFTRYGMIWKWRKVTVSDEAFALLAFAALVDAGAAVGRRRASDVDGVGAQFQTPEM